MDAERTQPGRPATAGSGVQAPGGATEPGRPELTGPDHGWTEPMRPDDLRARRGFLGSVKEKTASQLNTQKDRATDQLDQIARSVRQSTSRLRAERHDIVAVVLERAIGELERLSSALRERDVNDLVADLERFGRQRPALFVASTFAAGLALARFAKASTTGGSRSSGGRPSGGSRMSNPFNRPGPADAIGQERQ